MKKKIILGSGLIVILVAVLLITLKSDVKYTVKVRAADDYSPDRILTIYDDKNEEIKVKRVEYLDGSLLCRGNNTTAYFGDIESEKELRIILNDNSVKYANVSIEEVK